MPYHRKDRPNIRILLYFTKYCIRTRPVVPKIRHVCCDGFQVRAFDVLRDEGKNDIRHGTEFGKPRLLSKRERRGRRPAGASSATRIAPSQVAEVCGAGTSTSHHPPCEVSLCCPCNKTKRDLKLSFDSAEFVMPPPYQSTLWSFSRRTASEEFVAAGYTCVMLWQHRSGGVFRSRTSWQSVASSDHAIRAFSTRLRQGIELTFHHSQLWWSITFDFTLQKGVHNIQNLKTTLNFFNLPFPLKPPLVLS